MAAEENAPPQKEPGKRPLDNQASFRDGPPTQVTLCFVTKLNHPPVGGDSPSSVSHSCPIFKSSWDVDSDGNLGLAGLELRSKTAGKVSGSAMEDFLQRFARAGRPLRQGRRNFDAARGKATL